MPRIEKTVFICYRRTNVSWALAIYQNLTSRGYNVFFDFQSINSGDFEQVILGNIKHRAHFLVLLTPSALERCTEPGDWLRREIETALETRRNIVPLMFEGFDFGSPSISKCLTGELAKLKSYNGLSVPAEYFDAAMGRLCERFLNVPLEAVLHPLSDTAQQAVREQQAGAGSAPAVQLQELSAGEWFEQGFKHGEAGNFDEAIRCYSEAIRLKPDDADAYYNRGLARYTKEDLDGAIQDYSEAIRLKPDYAAAYYNRGLARYTKGDLDRAIQDYSEAIRLKPDDADAYYNRGLARYTKGDLDRAIQDYSEAIRLKPDYANAYYNRGKTRKDKGDLDGAIQDFSQAIRLKPDFAEAYNNRGNARCDKGNLDGAIEDYNQAIRLKPDYALAKNNLAEVQKKKKSRGTILR